MNSKHAIMKAAVINQFGGAGNIFVREMPKPNLRNHHVLIRVKASSINPVDCKVRNGRHRWAMNKRFPKIMGSDFSGVVVEAKSYKYQVGEEVYGFISTIKGGAYAEYLAINERKVYPKPKNLNHAQAAALPIVAMTTLQALNKIKKSQKVLINGCTGGVGHIAVQFAKHLGAKVTGICSTSKVPFAKKLGVDQIIDYSKEHLMESHERYDVIFDTYGNLSFPKISTLLTEKGKLIFITMNAKRIWQAVLHIFSKKKMIPVFARSSNKDFMLLHTLLEKKIIKPEIEKIYPLQAIANAQKHVETGHSKGKVVIEIPED